MRFGVLENLIAEAVLYEIYEGLARNRADAWARGRERNDEFTILVHNAERPNGAVERLVFGLQDAGSGRYVPGFSDGTVEGFIFGLQDAAAIWVQERAGNFFFGVVGAVAAKNYLTVAELPHYAVFVWMAEFFYDFGREKRSFPETLPSERTAEFACSTGGFG